MINRRTLLTTTKQSARAHTLNHILAWNRPFLETDFHTYSLFGPVSACTPRGTTATFARPVCAPLCIVRRLPFSAVGLYGGFPPVEAVDAVSPRLSGNVLKRRAFPFRNKLTRVDSRLKLFVAFLKVYVRREPFQRWSREWVRPTVTALIRLNC